MIGWKPKPFIFVHIPKCAGTSIEKVLIPIISNYTDFKDFSEAELSKYWLPGNRGLQHSRLRRYERQYDIKAFFTFSIVRNPWDRAVSQIKYLKAKTGNSVFEGNDFKKHIALYCQSKQNIWGHDLGLCQVDYLVDLKGNLAVNFIGRFEFLQIDFLSICKQLGLANSIALPHIFNSKRSKHYSEFYDQETEEMLRHRFMKDITLFDYQFAKPVNCVNSY